MGLAMVTRRGVMSLTSHLLEQVPSVRHAFSTRVGGTSPDPWSSLNLAEGSGDDPARVRDNWRRFMASADLEGRPVYRLGQIHSDRIHVVTVESKHRGAEAPGDRPGGRGVRVLGEGDGLVTEVPGVVLAALSADCVPVLIALGNPARIVGAVHAGWRGVVAGVLPAAIEAMRALAGGDASTADMTVAIGPHIRTCCFEVGEEVVHRFAAVELDGACLPSPDPGGVWRISLQGALLLQLRRAGVPESRIDRSTLCTRCRPDLLFSHRRDGPVRGTLAGIITRTTTG